MHFRPIRKELESSMYNNRSNTAYRPSVITIDGRYFPAHPPRGGIPIQKGRSANLTFLEPKKGDFGTLGCSPSAGPQKAHKGPTKQDLVN